MPQHPRARETDLLSQPLGDELLVFDESTHRAHSLNATATAVWRASDGTRTPGQIAVHTGLDPMVIDLALENLASSGLLIDYQAPTQRVSRRTVLQRTALAGAALAVALPVIRSIVAPTPAMATVSGGNGYGKGKGLAGKHCDAASPFVCGNGSFCNSVVSSCQRDNGFSCSHNSSCEHIPNRSAILCHSGACDGGCTPGGSSCPASNSSCRQVVGGASFSHRCQAPV